MLHLMNESEQNAPAERDESYVLHIDNFDGPLDLLWGLIKKAKIDITEVSISQITEQYIAYLRLMEELNIQVASDFILMASELLYYKSRALLPGGEMEDEYFVPPLPPELIQKLLEYKKYQNASRELRERFELQENRFARVARPATADDGEVLIEVSLFDLLSAFADVMNAARSVERQEIVFDEILVSDRIAYIDGLLAHREQLLFREIFTSSPSRAEIIATLLAILEMAKMRRIGIMQHRIFGDIRITRIGGVQSQ